jgi:3-oxoacyl-[acyl-carrier protein] reductase
MTSEISGRIALVTGASRGIGRAIAVSLAKAGVDVAVNFITHEKEAQEVCGEIKSLGRRSLAVQADVSQAEEVSRLIETIEKELGTISILINNAGIAKPRSLEDMTGEVWGETLRIKRSIPDLTSCSHVPQKL